jgi:hypothetical protein
MQIAASYSQSEQFILLPEEQIVSLSFYDPSCHGHVTLDTQATASVVRHSVDFAVPVTAMTQVISCQVRLARTW